MSILSQEKTWGGAQEGLDWSLMSKGNMVLEEVRKEGRGLWPYKRLWAIGRRLSTLNIMGSIEQLLGYHKWVRVVFCIRPLWS